MLFRCTEAQLKEAALISGEFAMHSDLRGRASWLMADMAREIRELREIIAPTQLSNVREGYGG